MGKKRFQCNRGLQIYYILLEPVCIELLVHLSQICLHSCLSRRLTIGSDIYIVPLRWLCTISRLLRPPPKCIGLRVLGIQTIKIRLSNKSRQNARTQPANKGVATKYFSVYLHSGNRKWPESIIWTWRTTFLSSTKPFKLKIWRKCTWKWAKTESPTPVIFVWWPPPKLAKIRTSLLR